MSDSTAKPAMLDDWTRREAISFDANSVESFNAAIDRMVAALDDSVELLGIGEPMHGAPEFLVLRNRLFQRLIEAHGFRAIAVESSFPRARVVNEYVHGTGDIVSYDDVQESGFSHGFGRAEANRELLEWMRAYNAKQPEDNKLRFYGCDSPTEMMWSDSPRRLVEFVLNYLEPFDRGDGETRRARIEELLGDDAVWENTEAAYDPAKSIGLSAAAAALRIEVEELISELSVRRPELVMASGEGAYLEAMQYAAVARQLLNYHASVARQSPTRIADLLGIRDAMMADNLAYTIARERRRGRVLAFAHNSHLQRGSASWQFGPTLLEWWPAGAHLGAMLGPRYAVIGVGVGTSEAHGIGPPEAGTIESHLTATPGPARLIPTHGGEAFDAAAIAALPTRSGGTKNPGYFPLTARSLTDFDWLAILDSIN